MSIPGDRQPLWWDPDGRLTSLSETTLQLARQLERRLFASANASGERAPDAADPVEPQTACPDPTAEDLALVWSAAAALRSAINDSAAAGAPAEEVATLHRRLDAELRAITCGAADEMMEERRALLEGVSHDIRSPLNSILFLADALLSEHSGDLNANQKRQIGVVYGAAVALVRLVNDLIDFARLSEGAGVVDTDVAFRIDGLLEDVQRLVAPLLHQRNATLTVRNEAPSERKGDPQLVSRLMINLLANAIDATPEDGAVEVLFAGDEGDRLRIEVVNDGVPADLDELRGRLDGRSRERQRKGPGWTHGLGLSISARLVQAARGTMTVDCPGGARTRFTVDLPFPEEVQDG